MRPALCAVVQAALLLAAAGGARAGCGDDLPAAGRLLASGGGWQLAFAPQPAPLATGRPFALDIALCAPPGQPLPARLGVDADMPAHRHGMNYRPTVRALGPGRFEAQGLMLHMPGRWRFIFELPAEAGQAPLRLTQEVDLR